MTSTSGCGPRSPATPSSTAGRPASATTPCPDTVAGSARRTHCASARLPPGRAPTSARTAFSTVRWSASGDGPEPSDHGTTQGLTTRRPAMSPSTSTASIGWSSAARAHARAPVKPAVAPDVETSTSVLESSRARKRRASSSSTAVPDSSARPGRPSASRWATTTTRRLDRPERTPTTVSTPAARSCVTVKAGRSVSSGAASVSRTRSASAASSAEPGARSGKRRPSSVSELRSALRPPPNARSPSKPCTACGEVAGDGRSSSENAATNSATSAGRKAARYTRTSSTERAYCALSSTLTPQMADRAPRILLVDDEQPIQTLLSFPLQRDGYEVVQASDGREALARFSEQQFDLVVLDLMLPRMDGLEVCKTLRGQGSTVPIIMLTAKSEEIDKVLGLELGADDYITKPFSMREFRSRVKAALRRAGMAQPDAADGDGPIEVRGLRIDPTKRTVVRDGDAVATTFVEFEILTALARAPGRVFTRDMLLAKVWGDSAYRDPRTIDVHIRHLREKIEGDPKEPEYLFTVRGVGYRFRDDEE